jgi:hypothetical protein
MGITKIFDGKKNFTIVQKMKKSQFRALTKKTTMRLHLQNVDFFNSGYKYSMDILQDVRGRKIQYIKLIPSNLKDQRKEILLGIDVQTKHIYNLIEMGKTEKNYFNR